MQQNTISFNTKGHIPTWYRDSLSTPKDDRPSCTLAKRVFIGSGEDCMMDELNNLITLEEEECTS